MTIDDAITKEREIADKYSDCWKYCKCSLNECNECEKYHYQIAEWLEALKVYSEEYSAYIIEDIKVTQNTMYNKAIYDFALALKNNYDDMPIILSKDDFNDFIDNNADLLIRGK